MQETMLHLDGDDGALLVQLVADGHGRYGISPALC